LSAAGVVRGSKNVSLSLTLVHVVVHCPDIPIKYSGEAGDTQPHSFIRPKARLRSFKGWYQGLVSKAGVEGDQDNIKEWFSMPG
jgi:hypothetical protein